MSEKTEKSSEIDQKAFESDPEGSSDELRFRSMMYAASVLAALLGTVLVAFIAFVKTGKSITQLAGLRESVTAALAAVASAYAVITILLIGSRSDTPLRMLLRTVGNFIGVLVGVNEISPLRPPKPTVSEPQPATNIDPEPTKIVPEKKATDKRRAPQKTYATPVERYYPGLFDILESYPFGSNDQYKQSHRIFRNIVNRLQGLSTTVLVRSFFNLLVGIGFAVFSIIFMSKVLESPIVLTENGPIVAVGIRIGISLTSVLVSYFFLRLYQSGLEDVRYIHDEITSIQLKMIAISDDLVEKLPLSEPDRTALLTGDRHLYGRNSQVNLRNSPESTHNLVNDLAELMRRIFPGK